MPRNRSHVGGRAVAGLTALGLALLGAATATAATPVAPTAPTTAASLAAARHDPGQGKQLIGYYTQWGVYSGFYEKNLVSSGQIDHLTELDYAFSDIATDGTCSSGDPWADYQRPFAATESVTGTADAAGQALLGNFNQLRELKAAHPGLKVVMAIGGWSWSGRFSGLAATAAGRQKFVDSCVSQYLKGDLPGLPAGAAAGVFDGFAIDWEYPGAPGNNNPYGPQDTPDFTALVATFHDALAATGAATGRHYLLTADTSASPKVAANLQLKPLSGLLDWFNVMTFDFHGSWEATGPTDFASATFQDPRDPNSAASRFSVADSVRYYESQGVPADKIGLAVPYYAHVWTGVAPGPRGDGLFQPATAGGGTPNYNQVVTAPGTTHVDPLAAEPYKYDAATGTFYTYEDPASLLWKAWYIDAAGLRGTFAWSLDGDTSDGQLTAALARGLGR